MYLRTKAAVAAALAVVPALAYGVRFDVVSGAFSAFSMVILAVSIYVMLGEDVEATPA
ncbi:MAG: hypothetical protein ACOCT0_05335 [Halobacteriota archaeon]